MKYYLIKICSNCGKRFGRQECNEINHKKYTHGYCKECSDLSLLSIDYYGEDDNLYAKYNQLFKQRNFIDFSIDLLKTCDISLLPIVISNIQKYNHQRGLKC